MDVEEGAHLDERGPIEIISDRAPISRSSLIASRRGTIERLSEKGDASAALKSPLLKE
jgi:hypothetical protein